LLTALALGLLMVLEVVPAPARYSAPAPIDPAPAYARFLRDAPGAGAVVELPTKVAPRPEPMRDVVAMLASAIHGRAVVNGHFGTDPKGYFLTASVFDQFPRADSLALAHRLGVRFVVVHGSALLADEPGAPGAVLARKVRLAASEPDAAFKLVAAFPDDGVEVYEIGAAAVGQADVP
jgi:hypothetical protein